jgi:hypothetical protein
VEGMGGWSLFEISKSLVLFLPYYSWSMRHSKKDNKIFLIYRYKEIQKGVVAKSYMTNGLLIYD